eukprot:PITA_32436
MAMFLRIEDRLDGISNYVVWKDRIQTVFEEAAVWDIVQQVVVPPTAADEHAKFTKNNAKAKRILMDRLKDYVVPQVRGNTYAYQMCTTLTTLYQSTSESRKMVLKEQLKNIRMTKVESVVYYLGRVKQHEIRKTGSGGVKIANEEDVALIARGKNKGTVKKGASSDGAKGKEKKKKKDTDMSNVKCWACQKIEQYATTCPERKNKGKKGTAALEEVEQFASQFNKDFAFITSRSSRSTSSNVWYIDSGASRHMTSAQEFFSELAERALDIEIVLGDDRTMRVVGVGIVTFERESSPPLKVMDVLYVPRMKKNLISVFVMEKGLTSLSQEGRY